MRENTTKHDANNHDGISRGGELLNDPSTFLLHTHLQRLEQLVPLLLAHELALGSALLPFGHRGACLIPLPTCTTLALRGELARPVGNVHECVHVGERVAPFLVEKALAQHIELLRELSISLWEISENDKDPRKEPETRGKSEHLSQK